MRPLCACEIFWRGVGCVSFLICWVWACVFVHVRVHGKGNEGRFRRGFLQNSCRCPEMSEASSPTKELELPLCLTWVIRFASFMQTLFSLTHTNIYTTVGTQTHTQVYSSWQALAAAAKFWPWYQWTLHTVYKKLRLSNISHHTHIQQIQKTGTVLKCRATFKTRWRKRVKEGGKIKAEKEENLKQ